MRQGSVIPCLRPINLTYNGFDFYKLWLKPHLFISIEGPECFLIDIDVQYWIFVHMRHMHFVTLIYKSSNAYADSKTITKTLSG